MMDGKMEQAELFALQEKQADDVPPPIMEWLAPMSEELELPWLTQERLFAEIESWDTICPERQCDGLHLLAQEMESSDFVPKNTTEQIIHFDEDEQLVVWEAFCPDWQFPDALAAHRFAADWMAHHSEDAVIVDEKSRRLVWRRSFGTVWVDGEEDVEVLSYHYLYDAINDSVGCLSAAQLVLGGF